VTPALPRTGGRLALAQRGAPSETRSRPQATSWHSTALQAGVGRRGSLVSRP